MIRFFTSAFYFPGESGVFIIIAIALGLVFGAVWLALYRPPLIQKPGLWVVGVASAFLTWAAIAFIQVPLQSWTGQALIRFWDMGTLNRWLLLAGIPQILLSGLVQEGAKLVPVVFYREKNHRRLSPRMGLFAGAIAGAGFGVFEAIWVHNMVFASGWSWSTVGTAGFSALLPFVERFFTVAFHIAASALAGYGLAKGKGGLFYLIASFLHGATNYGVVLLQKGILTPSQVEIYVALFAVITTSAALWLRWRRPEETISEKAE